MNRTQIIVAGVTVAAFGAAYFLFNGAPPPTPQPVVQAGPKVETDDVLIAAQDIPVGAQIADGVTAWQPWPKPAVSEFMIAKSAGPDAMAEVNGLLTRISFLRGEPIRRDKLVKAGAGGFMSAILPEGMRAVAIKIDNSGDSSAGGFILPNDRVDVIRIARDDDATKAKGVEVDRAQTILSNVRVLAIGQNVQEENGKKVVTGANATLELDERQAEIVVLAQHEGNANLHLALRSLVDSAGPVETNVESSGAKGLTVVRFGSPMQAVR